MPLALIGLVLQAQLVTPLPRKPLPAPAPGAVLAQTHQNTQSAGTLANGVLTLALDVVTARWLPEGDDVPAIPVLAFGEPGKAPLVPGPMLRVRQGTMVHLTLRNRSDSALVIGGLRAGSDPAADTVHLGVGATREVRFRLGRVGTFFYWGAFQGTTAFDRNWLDSQLNGAIVVDAPGAATDDHVLLMSEWFYPYPDRRQIFENSMAINGKGFPHTERLVLPQGDSVRVRIINTMAFEHPMHLHGFYYRIEMRDATPVPPSKQSLSNTDLLDAGRSVVFAFLPTTPGNWLLHCHYAFHADEAASLVGAPRDATATPHAASHAAGGHAMRGLVVPVQVTPRPGHVAPSMAGARTIRLLVQQEPARLPGGVPAIGFIEQHGDSVPAPNTVSLPGPVLELERGKPVRIVVANRLAEATSVHWHGLEIESYPDGVPHWSGLGDHIYGEIAPKDSFVAEFVPPRAGTYPYHSHLNDRHQINSGLYGAIIVTDRPRDPTRDHLIVTGGGGPEIEQKYQSPYALVNGRRSPEPLRLVAGVTHRLRFVTIHPDWTVLYTLRNDSTTARWRAVAKDGADLPAALATRRLAHARMGPGETADFEWTPAVPGRWRIDVASEGAGWQIPLEVIVESPAPRKPR